MQAITETTEQNRTFRYYVDAKHCARELSIETINAWVTRDPETRLFSVVDYDPEDITAQEFFQGQEL